MKVIQQTALTRPNHLAEGIMSTTKSGIRGKLRWVAWLCLIPFAVVLVFGIWLANREWKASRLLQSELTQLNAQGQPLDNEAWAAWFDARTHKEGTDAWLEVLSLSEASSRIAPDLPFVGEGFVPIDITPGMEWPGEPRVAEFLEVFDPLISKIHQAGEYPAPVWWPIQWGGFETLLPQYQESRSVCRLLQLKAMHSLWKNDPEEALKSIKSCLATASAVDSQTMWVTDLVHLAEVAMAHEMINRSLRMDVWNDQQLEAISKLLGQQREPIGSWKSCLIGERNMALTINNDYTSTDGFSGLEALKYIPRLPSDDLRILQYYQSMMDLANGGMAGLPERCVKWSATWEENFRRSPFSASTIWLTMFSSGAPQLATAYERAAIQQQLTKTAIAIKRFQKASGRFPNSLNELPSSDWPIVNWSVNNRTPLIYEVEEGQAKLSYEGGPGAAFPLAVSATSEQNFYRANAFEIVIR